MSEIKVNKITPRVACGTTQLGDSGDTITIPSGVTITNLGTATGFGGTGVVSWDTGSIKTAGFTAVTGTGYFCDTTGGAFTVTLPLSPAAGAVVGVADYAKTFDTNNVTLGRNGSNISGTAADAALNTEGIAVTLVYVDATKGWIITDSGNQSDSSFPTYIAATGGCITTCGDYKVHTFQGPGALCVSAVGNPAGSTTVDYMVVAGGGGAGFGQACFQSGGGGGAGGYRESPGTASGSYTVSPRGVAPAAALPVSVSPYPIVVGGGGPGAASAPVAPPGTQGSTSSFSTISSAGGGYGSGMGSPGPAPGGPGGSGGGGGTINLPSGPALCGGAGGPGNDPAQTPAQGTDGGIGESNVFSPTGSSHGGGGGGGATAAGGDGGAPGGGGPGGIGGAGGTSSINFTPTGRGGGGGGGQYNPNGGGTATDGGASGAGPAPARADGPNAVAYKGGGGGGGTVGSASGNNASGGNGGGGIVIIRYQYQ